MNKISRILVIIASVLLTLMFITPIWSISLEAPQYPEGLGLHINVSSISGHKQNDLRSINGLNHYIGMKIIEPDSILELKIMPYIILFFIISGLFIGIFKFGKLIIPWLILIMLISVVGLYDFYTWEYDYGHNLNPKAIIKIADMSYQPPLIGTKQLLNFTATSLPHIGGISMGISIILVILAFYFNKKYQK